MPEPGSPLESLILIVWRMRQDIKLQETRAMVTAIVAAGSDAENRDKVVQDAWQAYLDEYFPYKKNVIQNQDQRAIDYLKSEVKKGPLTVTPLQPLNKGTSKLRRQKDQVEAKRRQK
jgi:hypothetical protein